MLTDKYYNLSLLYLLTVVLLWLATEIRLLLVEWIINRPSLGPSECIFDGASKGVLLTNRRRRFNLGYCFSDVLRQLDSWLDGSLLGGRIVTLENLDLSVCWSFLHHCGRSLRHKRGIQLGWGAWIALEGVSSLSLRLKGMRGDGVIVLYKLFSKREFQLLVARDLRFHFREVGRDSWLIRSHDVPH